MSRLGYNSPGDSPKGPIPQAKVKIYPDSAYGFLFQHATEFAADVDAFLSGESSRRSRRT